MELSGSRSFYKQKALIQSMRIEYLIHTGGGGGCGVAGGGHCGGICIGDVRGLRGHGDSCGIRQGCRGKSGGLRRSVGTGDGGCGDGRCGLGLRGSHGGGGCVRRVSGRFE